jgi:hypothetical protein
MNGQAQAVVDSYMKDLKRELRALPRDRRQEILEDIEGHIDESLGRNGTASEADARNLLDQLGEPSEIARDARERFGIKPLRYGTLEKWAVALLAFGWLLGGLGWLLGVFLLWSSNAWNGTEKLLATILPLAVVFAFASSIPLGLLAWLLYIVIVPIWLAVRAVRRAAPAAA